MLRVTGFCVWNSPVTGEFPAQMASNAENVSILWRQHEWIHLAIMANILGINNVKLGIINSSFV